MKSKLRIIHYPDRVSSFNSDWIIDLMSQYFDFREYNKELHYEPGTLFYINWSHNNAREAEKLIKRGFRIVYDNLWEILDPPEFPAHVIHNQNWFWYNEALWYKHSGYDQYITNKNILYKALMPIRLRKPHRDFIVKELGAELDNMLWSYVEQGQTLPGDGDHSNWNVQRHFNPYWYNTTYCSLVVESQVNHDPNQPVFLTEKTFKPAAFRHPFIIFGNKDSLTELKQQGFVTFDNLWDESYDAILDPNERGRAVASIIKNLKPASYDALTIEKLIHNRNHFFDVDLCQRRIVEEIIEPILHYAETR